MRDAHRATADLLDGLDRVRSAPADGGVIKLIARRVAVGEREVLESAELTASDGLVGDGWYIRDKSRPGRQLTVMNARAIELIAGERENWALAGDQIYVDLDISEENLPAGTRLSLGTAVIEISEEPHTGCAKFAERYGMDAVRFVNTDEGKRLRLRGLNARVVQPGTISVGDAVTKID